MHNHSPLPAGRVLPLVRCAMHSCDCMLTSLLSSIMEMPLSEQLQRQPGMAQQTSPSCEEGTEMVGFGRFYLSYSMSISDKFITGWRGNIKTQKTLNGMPWMTLDRSDVDHLLQRAVSFLRRELGRLAMRALAASWWSCF